MTLLCCEISLHAQPAGASANAAGHLQLPANWSSAPWGKTFDDALATLATMPGLYTEPDGSFLWTAPPEQERWQLCGCLYDRGPELAYIDLFGQCSTDDFRKLLDCVRGTGRLMMQLREQGLFISECAFLTHAAD